MWQKPGTHQRARARSLKGARASPTATLHDHRSGVKSPPTFNQGLLPTMLTRCPVALWPVCWRLLGHTQSRVCDATVIPAPARRGAVSGADRRACASSAGAPDPSFQHVFPLLPGSLLTVHTVSPGTSVKVINGEQHDTIAVTAVGGWGSCPPRTPSLCAEQDCDSAGREAAGASGDTATCNAAACRWTLP